MQTKHSQPSTTASRHANSKTYATGGSSGILSASDYGEPDQTGSSAPHSWQPQQMGNENQYPTTPMGSHGSLGPLAAHPQVSFPTGPENACSLDSYPQPQPQPPTLMVPGSGPAGVRNSSRRNASSSPFIPKKRKPRP